MNFFLNTIKYEPEKLSEKSDPNKLNKYVDEDEIRAKIKEETIKKKKLKFDQVPINEVTQDRMMNVNDGGNESEEYVERKDGDITVLNPSKTKALKLKEI